MRGLSASRGSGMIKHSQPLQADGGPAAPQRQQAGKEGGRGPTACGLPDSLEPGVQPGEHLPDDLAIPLCGVGDVPLPHDLPRLRLAVLV